MAKSYGERESSSYGQRTIRVRVPATSHRRGYVAVRKDLGKPGIGPQLIPIVEKGSLTRFGYSIKESANKRRKALEKAIKKYGALTVERKLNAQVILRKRTQPKAREVFESDAEWVRNQYKTDGYVS